MRLVLPLLLLLGLAACEKKEIVHDQAWIKARVDSLVKVQQVEIDRRAAEELEQRIAIVVRQKVDSILEARRAATRPDTTAKPPHPMP